MLRAGWIASAIRILRHDLTLLLLVTAFVAVSAGVLTAAIHEPIANGVSAAAGDVHGVAPSEELLARAEATARELGMQRLLEVTRELGRGRC